MSGEIPEALHTFLGVLSFVLGLLVGSFLNVCVYRLPRGRSIVKPRSHCPNCENPVLWYDNIPIVSWLALGAKCRHCRATISWMYPLVEAITGILFFLVYWKFGLTVATPVYMVFVASLVLVTFVDLTDWTIPNEVTFPGIPAGVVCAVVAMMYPASGLLLDDPINSLVAALVWGGALFLLDQGTRLILRKPGMGFGDVKLMAMFGAFFGLLGGVVIIVVASILGSVIGISMLMAGKFRQDDDESEGHYLPFGPYLVLGALAYLFFGEAIVDRYLAFIQTPGPIV